MANAAQRRPLVGGIDGCKGGWILATVDTADAGTHEVSAVGPTLDWFETFAAARSHIDAVGFAAVGIDMPIGLPVAEPRTSDRLARERLGARRSTLFPTPSAAVLDATSHADANARNREAIGVGLSIQAWNLVPQIREVRTHVAPTDANRIFECHPESSFVKMTGTPLLSKKTAAGVGQRLAALAPFVADLAGVLAAAPHPCGIDDALDAFAVAWSAQRFVNGQAEILAAGEVDDLGYSLQLII